MRISTSALKTNRTRVNVATSNLANANSTRGVNGEGYKRRDPVIESILFRIPWTPLGGMPSLTTACGYLPWLKTRVPAVKYRPSHPDADSEGFVTYPDIDPSHEVVNLMSASRSYEANATAIETLKGMAQRALEILR